MRARKGTALEFSLKSIRRDTDKMIEEIQKNSPSFKVYSSIKEILDPKIRTIVAQYPINFPTDRIVLGDSTLFDCPAHYLVGEVQPTPESHPEHWVKGCFWYNIASTINLKGGQVFELENPALHHWTARSDYHAPRIIIDMEAGGSLEPIGLIIKAHIPFNHYMRDPRNPKDKEPLVEPITFDQLIERAGD